MVVSPFREWLVWLFKYRLAAVGCHSFRSQRTFTHGLITKRQFDLYIFYLRPSLRTETESFNIRWGSFKNPREHPMRFWTQASRSFIFIIIYFIDYWDFMVPNTSTLSGFEPETPTHRRRYSSFTIAHPSPLYRLQPMLRSSRL